MQEALLIDGKDGHSLSVRRRGTRASVALTRGKETLWRGNVPRAAFAGQETRAKSRTYGTLLFRPTHAGTVDVVLDDEEDAVMSFAPSQVAVERLRLAHAA